MRRARVNINMVQNYAMKRKVFRELHEKKCIICIFQIDFAIASMQFQMSWAYPEFKYGIIRIVWAMRVGVDGDDSATTRPPIYSGVFSTFK